MNIPAARKDLPLPIWERGYRGHGYWLTETNTRVGYVGLTPRVHRPIEYRWYLDNAANANTERGPVDGTCKTLRAAKRAVERAFRANYSWRFPESRGW